MENQLQVFTNEEINANVRVVIKDGEPWFVAKDVCKSLELKDVSMSIARLDDDEKGTSSICTPGGQQNMSVVNEPGLYNLILGSRKPEAKQFKRWITHEVLPSIRKTGRYENTTSKVEPTIDSKYTGKKFIIEGISGFFDNTGLAHFLAYDVGLALGIVINHPSFIEVNYTKMEYFLSHALTAIEGGDLYVKEPEMYTLLTRSRTRATKEFKQIMTFNVIPELKKYTHYKPQVTTTEIAKISPVGAAMKRAGNITVTNVVKDIGGAADEIVRIFGAARYEALGAAIALAEQSSGLNLEPLRVVLDSVEETATIEANNEDW